MSLQRLKGNKCGPTLSRWTSGSRHKSSWGTQHFLCLFSPARSPSERWFKEENDQQWVRFELGIPWEISVHSSPPDWLHPGMPPELADVLAAPYHLWKNMKIRESPINKERQTLHLSPERVKTMMQGITGQSVSLGFLETGMKNYRADPLGRHFWARKQKEIGNSQHGFTKSNHAWPSQLPPMTKCLYLWSSGYHLHHIWHRF